MPATQYASSDAGLPPNSYIYKVISTAARQDPLTYSKTDQLAIISSDESLRFLDPAALKAGVIIKNVNEKVTCLERANDAPSNVVATAGRDGMIRFWDKRSQQKAFEIQSRTNNTYRYLCDGGLTTTFSTQTHISISMRCITKFHRCWYREPRRWTARVSSEYLVCSHHKENLQHNAHSTKGPAQPISTHSIPCRIAHRHHYISPAPPKPPETLTLLQHRWPSQHLRHIPSRGRRRTVPSNQPPLRHRPRKLHVP